MRALSRRRSARTLATITAVAVAASTAVVLAPSANAFYGSDATVQGAVLSTAKIASVSGWTGPLTGKLVREDTNDWSNTVTPTTIGDAQVAPESTELLVADSPADRDGLFASVRTAINSSATTVPVNNSTTYTMDTFTPADGAVPAMYEGVSLRKAGSDGIALTACRATATTTTTPAQRTGCASAIGAAQAATWAAISPNLVWKSTAAVKATLLSAAAARKATKAPKGTKTKLVSTKVLNYGQGGREVTRTFKTTGKGVRFSGPSSVSVVQFGNQTNAKAAFANDRTLLKQLVKLHATTADRFTVSTTETVKGKKVPFAVTVVRYSDVIVGVTCDGNSAKKPTMAALRTCSQRLAAAELKKAKPLFSGIK